MKNLRTFSYILWGLSVVILVIGGISRLTVTPVVGLDSRVFWGGAVILQLYTITLLLIEIAEKGRG